MKKKFMLRVLLLLGLSSCKSITDHVGIPPAIPEVTTFSLSIITQYTAITGGNVSADAGITVTQSGICWSTDHNPTIADSKTTNGPGTGNFSTILTGLIPNTTYYIRAYATNFSGTGYGNELSFMTLQVSATTVTDIDGNVYPVITIGNQVWMKENLKTTHYRNGDALISGLTDETWGTTQSGAFTIYNNDAAITAQYGNLYNWYACIDSRKIAPQGWHVPTKEEWETLITSVGDFLTAGGELKETGLAHWNTPNSGATNNSGFIALPAGSRLDNGTFIAMGDKGWWWTTTEYLAGSGDAEAVLMFNDSPEASQVTGSKATGASIRCVKDQPFVVNVMKSFLSFRRSWQQ